MELTDDIKRELIKKSARQRAELQDEVKLFSERTEKMITNALVVGGALALTYVVVKQFTKSKKKKSKGRKIKVVHAQPHEEVEYVTEEPRGSSFLTDIGSAIAGNVTAFLLTLAKEKLIEYLQSQSQKETEQAKA